MTAITQTSRFKAPCGHALTASLRADVKRSERSCVDIVINKLKVDIVINALLK